MLSQVRTSDVKQMAGHASRHHYPATATTTMYYIVLTYVGYVVRAEVLNKVLPFVHGSAAGYQDRSALLLLLSSFVRQNGGFDRERADGRV